MKTSEEEVQLHGEQHDSYDDREEIAVMMVMGRNTTVKIDDREENYCSCKDGE